MATRERLGSAGADYGGGVVALGGMRPLALLLVALAACSSDPSPAPLDAQALDVIDVASELAADVATDVPRDTGPTADVIDAAVDATPDATADAPPEAATDVADAAVGDDAVMDVPFDVVSDVRDAAADLGADVPVDVGGLLDMHVGALAISATTGTRSWTMPLPQSCSVVGGTINFDSQFCMAPGIGCTSFGGMLPMTGPQILTMVDADHGGLSGSDVRAVTVRSAVYSAGGQRLNFRVSGTVMIGALTQHAVVTVLGCRVMP